MLINFTPNSIPVMDMTSMEVSLLYYLAKEDICQQHLVKLSYSSFYLTMFGEIYKAGNSRKMQIEFNNAINHFKELGLISIVLDSHNCKIIDISNLYKTDVIPYFNYLATEEYRGHKIFRDLDIAKHIKLKVFRTYMHLLTACCYDDICLPDGYVYKDLGLSYNTYIKYIKYLRDVKVIELVDNAN